MKLLTAALVLCTQLCVSIAQETAQGQRYTDPLTGINLAKYEIEDPGKPNPKLLFGFALPKKNGITEYIGHVVGPRGGWAGISHTRSMTKSLLLVLWSTEDRIQASFRYATDYDQPSMYLGDSKFTELKHDINATHFMITYRCERCFSWAYEGVLGGQNITEDKLLFGWASGGIASEVMNNTETPVEYHDRGVGLIEGSASLASRQTMKRGQEGNYPRLRLPKQHRYQTDSPPAIPPVSS